MLIPCGLCRRVVHYISSVEYSLSEQNCETVSKMLNGLIKSLKKG
jgi:hypothetical protein